MEDVAELFGDGVVLADSKAGEIHQRFKDSQYQTEVPDEVHRDDIQISKKSVVAKKHAAVVMDKAATHVEHVVDLVCMNLNHGDKKLTSGASTMLDATLHPSVLRCSRLL